LQIKIKSINITAKIQLKFAKSKLIKKKRMKQKNGDKRHRKDKMIKKVENDIKKEKKCIKILRWQKKVVTLHRKCL